MTAGGPLLDVDHLTLRYQQRNRVVEAVSDISFTINRGETVGLVGESGCGKTSTGRAILHMPPPTRGHVRLNGQDLTGLVGARLRRARRSMQLIFQDPVSALNPRRRVSDIVGEGLAIAGESQPAITEKVTAILGLIGMDADAIGGRRPHELSGGQCQRIAIARALILRPELLICDEPVASLDVSVQGQVLNLLEDMRAEFGLSMLFISHDLSVVHNISDRIAVMYLGRVVELGGSDAVTRSPAHPYTRALLAAVPTTDLAAKGHSVLHGELPSLLSPPSGCRFRTRCPIARQKCTRDAPELNEIRPGHQVACHFPLISQA